MGDKGKFRDGQWGKTASKMTKNPALFIWNRLHDIRSRTVITFDRFKSPRDWQHEKEAEQEEE